jgi:hypothetical protein
MTNDDGRKPEGAPERSPKAGAGAPSGVDGNGPKRFSVQRKMAIVARLLRGEPLELVARETNVSIGRLSEWRERALAGAATALKERERDDRDDEIALQNRLPRFNSWRGLQDLVKLGLMRVNIKYNRLAERPLRLRGSAFPSSQARGRQAESLDAPSRE